jgi:L-asparaginase
MKPKITIYSLGGTIAMSNESNQQGVAPRLTADDLVKAIPQLNDHAEIETNSFLKLASANLTFKHLIELAHEIEQSIARGKQGFVITQGTDTIEETAFALQLICQIKGINQCPIVITGAMRNPTQVSADGSANLLAATIIASSQESNYRGVLVAFNDQIHLPQYISKTHASALDTFSSAPYANCGAIIENQVKYFMPAHLPPLKLDQTLADDLTTMGDEIDIPILKPGIAESPSLIEMVTDSGAVGVILEAAGAGHISVPWATAIKACAEKMPVILASRAKGYLPQNTYGYEGAEIDLLSHGLISAGMLSPLKARVLLAILTSSKNKMSLNQIKTHFKAFE